jgi:hypothetical protein
VEAFSRERMDMDLMQTRHVKFLSATLLNETLQQTYQLSMSYCFQRIRDVGEIKHRGKEGVKRMRKVLKRHRADKLKKFLNLWFTNALKPMKTKK